MDCVIYITEYYFYYAYHRSSKTFSFFLPTSQIAMLDLKELTKLGPANLIRLKDLSSSQFQHLLKEITWLLTESGGRRSMDLLTAKL